MTIDFCLPVRNEEKILAVNVRRLRDFLITQNYSFDWNITIIVNGSIDSSSKIADSLISKQIKVKTITAAGKGIALKTGFRESSADVLVFMDVDLAVALENITDLIGPMMEDKGDLIIGSRLLPKSQTARSGLRDFNSRVYNFLSRLVLQHSLSDLQCGFKAVRRTTFNQVLPFLHDDQWFFDTELVILAKHLGQRIIEIPVNWQENRYDERKSKVRVLRDSWPFIKNLFLLRVRLKEIK